MTRPISELDYQSYVYLWKTKPLRMIGYILLLIALVLMFVYNFHIYTILGWFTVLCLIGVSYWIYEK